MRNRRFSRILPFVVIGAGLSACENLGDQFANLDFDLRGNAGGLDTSEAARRATADRPKPDSRGVISYPNYQVAVARRGDTVQSLAGRLGGNAQEIARLNGLRPTDQLNSGEVVALPTSLPSPAAPASNTGAQNGRPVDITQIATTAIDRAPNTQIAQATPSKRIDGPEPLRHQVARGETAFSIARLYNISVRSLSDWNGLGPDLAVREGQFLLVPVTSTREVATQVASAATTAPGAGTPTPAPPSASKPLPPKQEPLAKPKPAEAAPVKATASSKRLIRPVAGDILRPYKKKSNEGIDIAAKAGTPVQAAGDGEVAAITRDTDQVPILVLRHPGGLLTVYANISDIKVKKGDQVKRGQSIAKIGKGNPSFLHFEVREGFESVNPIKYLK